MRYSVLEGKTGRAGLQIDIFRSRCYEPNSHISPIWKALKSLINWRLLLMASRKLHKTKKKQLLQKKNIYICAWLHIFPVHQKSHIFWHFTPTSVGDFSGLSEILSPGYSPHFVPTKPWFTTLLLCNFLSQHCYVSHQGRARLSIQQLCHWGSGWVEVASDLNFS